MEYTQRMSALWEKYDCNPLKSMAPIMAQAPIFIGFFGALRSLATAQVSASRRYPDICFHGAPKMDPNVRFDSLCRSPP